MLVVYISHVQFSSKIADHWLFNDLKMNGIQCKYYDVGALVRPNYVRDDLIMADEKVFISYKEFASQLAIQSSDRTIYVMFFLPDASSLALYRIMTKYACCMILFAWGSFPHANFRSIKKKGLKGFVKEKASLRVLNGLVKRIHARLMDEVIQVYIRLGLVSPLDTLFTAGSVAFRNRVSCRQRVPVNLCDNDNFIEIKEKTCRKIVERYVLFIDSNMVGHHETPPDEYIMDPSVYFNKLNRAFDTLEKDLDLKVVISAHPCSVYTDDTFEGRVIVKGSTAELVKYAEFVIAHQSTAISYAVLFEKPLLLIKTDEMERIVGSSPLRPMQGVAEKLNVNIFRAEDLATMTPLDLPYVDNRLYNKYKYEYILSFGVETGKNIDNVLPKILEIFNRNETLRCNQRGVRIPTKAGGSAPTVGEFTHSD